MGLRTAVRNAVVKMAEDTAVIVLVMAVVLRDSAESLVIMGYHLMEVIVNMAVEDINVMDAIVTTEEVDMAMDAMEEVTHLEVAFKYFRA